MAKRVVNAVVVILALGVLIAFGRLVWDASQGSSEFTQFTGQSLGALFKRADWWGIISLAILLLALIYCVVAIRRRRLTAPIAVFLVLGVGFFLFNIWHEGKSLEGIYAEYAPHFASEMLITFFAIALLERSITWEERRRERKFFALGALRFFVRFSEQRNCNFTDQDRYWLDDELTTFNLRRDQWRRQMSNEEQDLFDLAAREVEKLVKAVGSPVTGQATKDRQTLVEATNQLRSRYQNCRAKFWENANPDEIYF
jgi:hypothetical protein